MTLAPATTWPAGSGGTDRWTTRRSRKPSGAWHPFAGLVYFHLLLANLAERELLDEPLRNV